MALTGSRESSPAYPHAGMKSRHLSKESFESDPRRPAAKFSHHDLAGAHRVAALQAVKARAQKSYRLTRPPLEALRTLLDFRSSPARLGGPS